MSVPMATAVEFMPADSLRAGMTGVGLTVLKGTRIDSFFVEKYLAGYRPKLMIDEVRKLFIDDTG